MTYVDYLLTKLIEECSEIQKPCSKAILFGIDSYNPFDTPMITNIEEIYKEFTDVYAVMELLHEELRATEFNVPYTAKVLKQKKLKEYYEIHKEIKENERN